MVGEVCERIGSGTDLEETQQIMAWGMKCSSTLVHGFIKHNYRKLHFIYIFGQKFGIIKNLLCF